MSHLCSVKIARKFQMLTLALLVVGVMSFSPATASAATCFAAWNSSTAYTGGQTASYNSVNYTAAYWTQNQNPSTNNGPQNSGQPWISNGACGSGATPTPTAATPTPTAATPTPTAATPTPTPTPTSTPISGGNCWAAWVSSTAYNGGAQVSFKNVNYQAAFWTQNNEPDTSSGPAGSGQPWVNEGSCTSGPTPTPTKATPTPTPCSTCTSSLIFSPYKDITVDANWNTGAQQTTASGASEPVTQAMPNKTLTWAFATGDCTSENWAGITPALEASNVQAFVSAGKDYIISTGGQAGSFTCGSAAGLAAFINRYNSANMLGVDFDIESGQSSATINSLVSAVKGVQGQFPNMRFSFTVASFGAAGLGQGILNSTGQAVMNAIQSTGLGGHWTINPMAFDYGSPNPSFCTVVNGTCEMAQSAIGAMESINQGWGTPYSNIEVTLEVPTDDGGAPFTMGDVTTLCNWVRSNGVAGVHFWSLDRDTGLTYTKAIPSACGTN